MNTFVTNYLALFLVSFLVYGGHGTVPCNNLMAGQFKCYRPEVDIHKQAYKGCGSYGFVNICCEPTRLSFSCKSEKNCSSHPYSFTKKMACRHTGEKYKMGAILLALFLGFLGADRFYVGSQLLGFIKILTLGCGGILVIYDIFAFVFEIVVKTDKLFIRNFFDNTILNLQNTLYLNYDLFEKL